ncbi:hypothetical protein CDAR_233121 [Caerostris darwini]|uniref:Uncharacterized protein n=1 Tax=Caerostris darwini TaxID=1538125 RepID=A0AAV4Q4D9_9ARAC|nr:hypothetical protein CDAR_233121 [Caerostris darwini]
MCFTNLNATSRKHFLCYITSCGPLLFPLGFRTSRISTTLGRNGTNFNTGTPVSGAHFLLPYPHQQNIPRTFALPWCKPLIHYSTAPSIHRDAPTELPAKQHSYSKKGAV